MEKTKKVRPFEIQQQPLVQPDLELSIAQARTHMPPEQLIEHVIKLYGAELSKANDLIVDLNKLIVQQKRQMIETMKRVVDDCDHPQCVADRKRFGYSDCAGGHIARRVVDALEEHKIKAEDTPA